MTKAIMTSDNWVGVADIATAQTVDSIDDVLNNVEMLNGENRTLILIDFCGKILGIGGGEDKNYICFYDDDERSGLIAAFGDDESPVEIVVGGQPGVFKMKNILNFDQIEIIVDGFLDNQPLPDYFVRA